MFGFNMLYEYAIECFKLGEIRDEYGTMRKNCEGLPNSRKYNLYLKQVDVVKQVEIIDRLDLLMDITSELQQIRNRDNDGFWVATDNLGSGYDIRYKDIRWMDTR